MYYLYILQSLTDGNFYTGTTNNLKRRLQEHNNGKNISTKGRRPFKLIYCEIYLLKKDADNRERYLKTSMGKRVIKKHLSEYLKINKINKLNITNL